MKKNNKKIKDFKTYIYNLAIKRSDGKVEQSTLFRDNDLFTEEEVAKLGEKFSCDVLLEYVGTVNYADIEVSKKNSFVFKLPSIEAVVDSSFIAHKPEELDKIVEKEQSNQTIPVIDPIKNVDVVLPSECEVGGDC